MKKIICIIILLLFINPITVFSAKKGWYQDEMNNWHFIDYQSGNKKYGWIADGAYWYYLDSQEGIMQTGWQSIDEKCYYFTGNGRMVIGNNLIDDVYYHFAKDGHLTGIIEQKGIPVIKKWIL